MKLKPGMTANVTIQTASNENVLRVPSTALRFRPTPELFAALGQSEPAPAATSGTDGTVGATGTTGTRGAKGANGANGASESANGANGAKGASDGSAPGRVWVLRNGALESVRVRTGVTDGALTAIVGGDLKEGDQAVTAVTGLTAAPAQSTTANPLLPTGRRGGAGGGGARPGGGR
jgi:HlyD family secretion protein